MADGQILNLVSQIGVVKSDLQEAFLETQKEMVTALREITKLITELHEWHNVRDDEGMFRWHNRSRTEEVLKKLVGLSEQQTKLLTVISTRLESHSA